MFQRIKRRKQRMAREEYGGNKDKNIEKWLFEK